MKPFGTTLTHHSWKTNILRHRRNRLYVNSVSKEIKNRHTNQHRHILHDLRFKFSSKYDKHRHTAHGRELVWKASLFLQHYHQTRPENKKRPLHNTWGMKFLTRAFAHTYTRWKNTFHIHICKRDTHKRPDREKNAMWLCTYSHTKILSHVLRMCAFTYTRDKGGGGWEIFVSVKRGKTVAFLWIFAECGREKQPPPVSRPVGSQNTHSGPPGGGFRPPTGRVCCDGWFFRRVTTRKIDLDRRREKIASARKERKKALKNRAEYVWKNGGEETAPMIYRRVRFADANRLTNRHMCVLSRRCEFFFFNFLCMK